MHFYTHEDVKKAVTLGKLIMKHPIVTWFKFIFKVITFFIFWNKLSKYIRD